MPALTAVQERGLRKIEESTARYVIGVDEVGAGAYAGKVTVCAAVVRKGWSHPDVKDSKLYKTATALRTRENLAKTLPGPHAVLYNVVLSNAPAVIDVLGLRHAIDECASHAVEVCLDLYPDAIVVMDGDVLPAGMPLHTTYFPKADGLVPAVSAASIIAKEHRDAYMHEQHKKYPRYGFNTNVGYGTEKHERGLELYGPCPIHRFSIAKVRKYVRAGG